MRAARFRSLFIHLASAAAGMSVLTACSSIDASDFQSDACGDELEGVTPGVPVDYLELRSDPSPQPPTDVTQPREPIRVLAQRGEACSTAKEPEKCKLALDALRPADVQSPRGIDF